MVATVGVYQSVGGIDGSPTSPDSEITTSTRLQTKDQFAPSDTAYPVPIPADSGSGYGSSGFNYSYWIHVYLKITGGDFTQINNIKFWCDGTIGWAFGTAGELRVGVRQTGDDGCPMDTEYDVAHGVGAGGGEGLSGDPIEDVTNGHGYYKDDAGTKIVDIETFTSGAKMTVDSTNHSAAEKCKAVLLQVKVDDDATQGEQTDETLTFSYDEI